ncbi:MAG: choice-of-anchor C family protein [Thermoleophilia bacterium]
MRIDRTGPGGNPGAELVTNGGFETPAPTGPMAPDWEDLTADFTGWTLDSGTVAIVGPYWAPAAGNQSLELNGGSPGSVSQALGTTAGATYRITFRMAGNTDGGPAVKTLRVNWGGTALRTVRFDTTGNSAGAMGWTTVVLEATAAGPATHLQFQSLTPGQYGPVIDEVSVTEQAGPTVSGGSLSLAQPGVHDGHRVRRDRRALRRGLVRAPHQHRRRHHLERRLRRRIGHRHRRGRDPGQYRGIDNAGNAGPWAPATADAGSTVRLDRTAPTDPTVSGGSLSWQSVPSVTVTGSGSTDAVSSVTGYEHRESTDGGATWSAASAGASSTVTAEGETLVQFRSVDAAGNTSAWAPSSATAGSTVRINRSGPSAPTATGGSLTWQSVPSVTVTGSGATVLGGTITGYEHRTSTDGGTTWDTPAAGATLVVTAEGETLVQFRATDDAGNTGPWGPGSPIAGSTVRIDRTDPTAPTVTGGSLAWQNTASITVTGSGANGGDSGLAGYEHRESTDGGTTWTAAATGPSFTATSEGETLVQIRSVDNAGNTSAWTPSAAVAGNTARIDRGAPTDPTVSGGSLAWQSVASVTVTATGSTDAVSSVTGYEHRESTDGGTTWSAAAAGASSTVTAEGETLVQFRSVDAAGNTGAWTPRPALPRTRRSASTAAPPPCRPPAAARRPGRTWRPSPSPAAAAPTPWAPSPTSTASPPTAAPPGPPPPRGPRWPSPPRARRSCSSAPSTTAATPPPGPPPRRPASTAPPPPTPPRRAARRPGRTRRPSR